MFTQARKIVVIVEQMMTDKVCALIEKHGAKGYSVIDCSGKGHHGTHGQPGRASVAQDFALSRIEAIVSDRAAAERMTFDLTETYLKQQSGIVYLQDVEIVRSEKF
jgi:nitrogen regulatory protein PII